MTGPSLSPHTHTVPSLDSTVIPTNATPPLPSAQTNGVAEDEEDYTIKCICGFQEDDGSTILCETCQTWQHIVCYYRSQGIPTPGDDEEHTCDDCGPRSKHLNRTKAAEAQRQKRAEAIDALDSKIKKPAATKGPKRKKAIDHAINGGLGDKHHGNLRNGANGSPREGTNATKRPRAGHRSSNSTQIVPLKLPAQPSRRSASASHTLQSPSKGSNMVAHPDGEPYSINFMHLYDNDPGDTPMEGNLMNDITTANNLSLWSHDADAVREATNGRSHQDIFMRCEQSVDDMEKPIIEKHTKTDESRDFHGRHPRWTYLTVESPAPKGMVVGELRGKIGHKKDYAQNEANRWEYLTHPLPFVFFHPTLPIYIDTRHEGNIYRYVRRSCNFNLHLVTILEDGPVLRFCFCATRDIQPGEELTLAWTPDEHVRHFLANSEPSGMGEDYVRNFYAKVLSDFGGCANNDHENCSCSRWSRKLDQKLVNGHRSSTHQSSNSNGRTSISRSGSEGLKHHDDDERDDDQSTSASSDPNSRGATPLEHSEREKRKFNQMLERLSHMDEPKRKRQRNKRTSGSTHDHSNPPASASRISFPEHSEGKHAQASHIMSVPTTPSLPYKARYVNAATSQSSTSPSTQSPKPQASSNSQLNGNMDAPTKVPAPKREYRPNYVDLGLQVDMDEVDYLAGKIPHRLIYYDQYLASLPKHPPQKKFITKSQMVQRRVKEHQEAAQKAKAEYLKKLASVSSEGSAPIQNLTLQSSLPIADASIKDQDGDVPMGDDTTHVTASAQKMGRPLEDAEARNEDGGPSKSPRTGSSSLPSLESPLMSAPALPSPSEAKANSETRIQSTGLHIELPSPQPSNNTSPNLSTSVDRSPVLQTPTTGLHIANLAASASLVQPSPVKKKLSLGDYMRRSSTKEKVDASTTAGAVDKETSPSTTTADTSAKPLEPLAEETKEKDAEAGNVVMETPKAETDDPMNLDPVSA